ncbi:MAG: SsrA-binding protein SmpB [Mycoplasmatota bacterium]|nr:SsrA-binding protein SmpB [Mycoplasmatota bacterium]
MEIVNRQASYNYYIDETYETGIVLTGTEIKSIRNGACNLKDSYAIIKNGEIYLLNTHISPYKQGNIFNHEETRTRKLLLHKKEILKISNKVNIEGYTLIPLKIYFKKSKAKLLLGVCRGKKNYNKIQVLKEKDLAREMAKNTKFR